MPLTVRKLPGLRKFANITLKRGYTQDDDAVGLVPQHRQRQRRPPQRHDRAHGRAAHSDVLRWHFENAWPNKIEGPTLKATGNEVAIESHRARRTKDITLEASRRRR